MRGFFVVSVGLFVTGCTVEQRTANSTSADIDAAADAAQGDIDTYAANVLQASAPVAAPRVVAGARGPDTPRTAPPTRSSLAAMPPMDDNVTDTPHRCTSRVSERVDDARADVRQDDKGERAAIWQSGRAEGSLGDRGTSDPAGTGCPADKAKVVIE